MIFRTRDFQHCRSPRSALHTNLVFPSDHTGYPHFCPPSSPQVVRHARVTPGQACLRMRQSAAASAAIEFDSWQASAVSTPDTAPRALPQQERIHETAGSRAAPLARRFSSAPALRAQLPEKVGDTPVPSLAPIVKKASPAVVNIATRGTLREQRPRNPLLEDPFFRRFFDAPDLAPRERQFQSAGSGVIVDAKNGYIITNAHVIENADEITVTLLDDRQLKAKIVGRDKPSDVAVLKVDREESRRDAARGFEQGARSATSCSRSAIRSRSATRSPPASSARSAAPTTIRSRTRTSSRPTRRSIPAIPAARS